MADGHHHHHHGGHCGCGHAQEDHALSYSLYTKIDIENVKCYNEHVSGAGKTVFKPWDNRLDTTMYVDSDVDEELLFYIPFTGNVKLKGIALLGGEGNGHPNTLRLFKNRNPQGFDEVQDEPDQIIPLTQDNTTAIEYPLKMSKFNGIDSLVVHVPGNHGNDEVTRVYYVGLSGDYMRDRRGDVTIATYEASPNPSDHNIKNFQLVHDFIS
jgi:hypothetical protein